MAQQRSGSKTPTQGSNSRCFSKIQQWGQQYDQTVHRPSDADTDLTQYDSP
jgi:hypothetical protein